MDVRDQISDLKEEKCSSPSSSAASAPSAVEIPSVLVTVPTREAWRLQCAATISREAARNKGDIIHFQAQPVEWARNQMAKLFLESDAAYQLQFDDDQEMPEGGLARLLALAEAKGAAIVSGVVPIRIQGVTVSNVQLFTEKGIEWVSLDNLPAEPFTAEAVGTGCLLVHRRVYERVGFPFYDTRQDGVYKLGEDIFFCKACRAAGFEIWVEPSVLCEHHHVTGLLSAAREKRRVMS